MVRVILDSVNGELKVTDDFVTWNQRKNVITRSKTYEGVIISESLDLTFIGAAYNYLLLLDDTYDVAAVCTVVIQNYNNNTGDWDDDFSGLINFTTKKQNDKSGRQITYSAYSDDFANKIIERQEIKIPYDRLETLSGEVITPFTNEYESVDIIGMAIADNNIDSAITDFDYDSDGSTRNAILKIVNDITNPSYQDVTPRTYGGSFLPSQITAIDNFYLAKIKSTISFDIDLDFSFTEYDATASPVIDWTLYIMVYKNTYDSLFALTAQELLHERQIFTEIISGNVGVSLSTDLEVNQGVSIYVYHLGINALGNSRKTRFAVKTDSTIVSNFSQLSDPTSCNFVPPIQAFERCIEAYTDISDNVVSDYFETDEGSTIFLTNGKLIRQYPIGYEQTTDNNVAQLTFSFKELFDNFNKIRNLGAGVEYDGAYKLRIEPKEYFYQSDVILEIGKDQIELDSFERARDLTHYYSVINTGYSHDSIEELGVMQEYNSKISVSSPIVHENELDLVSSYIGSGYAIEITRSKPYSETSTTDYKFDNNNFFFSVYDSLGTWIQRTTEGFAEVNGIDLITTPINLIISASRNLRRWGNIISVGLKGYAGGVLKYNTSEITTNLGTRLTSEGSVVRENADININDLDTALFSGNVDSFSAPVGSSTYNLLKADPYKIIKYWDMLADDWAYGNIEEVSTSPIDKKTNWKLKQRLNYVEGQRFRLVQDGAYRLLEDGSIRIVSD